MKTTEIKERPILFSAPMVRALLDGRKTQTRRVIKPQPTSGRVVQRNDGVFRDGGTLEESAIIRCPYGVPGDRLWVREALWHDSAQSSMGPGNVRYAADCETPPNVGQVFPAEQWVKVPSIHMPRWASRLTLELTDVRVHCLHGITEEDAIAEGMKPRPSEPYDCMDDPREQFRMLWDSINGHGAWAANPWVWALIFRKATT